MVSGRSCKDSNLDSRQTRAASGRLRAASGRCPDGAGGVRTAPDGSGRLLVGPGQRDSSLVAKTAVYRCSAVIIDSHLHYVENNRYEIV